MEAEGVLGSGSPPSPRVASASWDLGTYPPPIELSAPSIELSAIQTLTIALSKKSYNPSHKTRSSLLFFT